VGRYLTGKFKMTPEEIQNIFANGLRLFPIFEVGGYENSYFTSSQGTADAISAIEAATILGFGKETIIYFAVDYDAYGSNITDNVMPYFSALKSEFNTDNPRNYRIGIYAPRNICTLVAEKGYSCSSFVCDMSSGFSGNLGYPLPKDWAFDQISTVTVGSGSGAIEIDNNICSNKYTGVSSMDGKPKDITKDLTDLMIRYEYMWTGESTILDLYTFYELVRNNGELDLKNQGWNDSEYIFNGEVIPGDGPGNILYGYLGKAYGDDPRDQKNIKKGINYYNNLH